MKIAILGFGREGKSLETFLKKHNVFGKAKITILDQSRNKNYLKNLTDFDVIFRSPGIPYSLPQLKRARENGVRLSSATQLFFSSVPHEKIIGVTGTKGKGTTATLIHHILKSADKKAILAGNIGIPMLDTLPQVAKANYVILELSSFQLQDLKASPHIAVVLDIFPDHLDAHTDMKEYLAAKERIIHRQKKSDVVFYFKNNARSRTLAAKSAAKKIPVSPKTDTANKNYEMAIKVSKSLGISDQKIRKALKTYKGLPHRLEFVKKKSQVSFYNDSAATNPEATALAIRSFTEPLVLIAGGTDKKLDYTPLVQELKKSKHVQRIILIGENKSKLRKLLKSNKYQVTSSDTLRLAVRDAYNTARELVASHMSPVTCTVLFSPASASFDMFKSYTDRGEKFKKILKKN